MVGGIVSPLNLTTSNALRGAVTRVSAAYARGTILRAGRRERTASATFAAELARTATVALPMAGAAPAGAATAADVNPVVQPLQPGASPVSGGKGSYAGFKLTAGAPSAALSGAGGLGGLGGSGGGGAGGAGGVATFKKRKKRRKKR